MGKHRAVAETATPFGCPAESRLQCRLSVRVGIEFTKNGLTMIDTISDDTKAVLLLCGYFGSDRDEKPLSQSEYSRVVRWLVELNRRPGDLVHDISVDQVAGATQIDEDRLERLIQRGVKLAFALEEWERNGIWVISRGDAEYPEKLKKHLKGLAPAILFGIGDKSLCEEMSLGMVGSRNVDQDGEVFARSVAQLCAENGYTVVSGGARGVDQISMNSSITAGGKAIGVLAENLLKKSLEREARQAIAQGQLLLLSPYHPTAKFTVGTAMARNKVIYGIADHTLVVSAELQKGGTWAGAEEELKRPNHRPVFVRGDVNAPSGNRKLLEMGAIAWPSELGSSSLTEALTAAIESKSNGSSAQPGKQQVLFDVSETAEPDSVPQEPPEQTCISSATAALASNPGGPDFADEVYLAVLPFIKACANEPGTVTEFARRLDVIATQVKKWLERAFVDGVLDKKQNPVRFSLRK